MRYEASALMVILLLGCGSTQSPPDEPAGAGGSSGGADTSGGNSGSSGSSTAAGTAGASGATAAGGTSGGTLLAGNGGGAGGPPLGTPNHRIAAGNGVSCAISAASEVVCWGSDDGAPASYSALAGTYRSVAVGLDGQMQAVCASDASGSVECIQWDGTAGGIAGMVLSEDCLPDSPVEAFVLDRKNPGNFGYVDASGLTKTFPLTVACPVGSAPSSIGPARRLALADNHACVVTAGGAIECWNLNLGALQPTPSDTYVDVAVSTVTACAVTRSGKLRCWDYMGVEDTSSSSLPGEANALGSSVVAVASDNAGNRLCALLADGRAVCAVDFNNNVATTNLVPLERLQELAVGQSHVCGIRSDQSVLCVPFGCSACESDIAPPPNLKVIAP
jgi:hypothetical protein